MTVLNQHLINHVVFVLDASGSMNGLRQQVIDVFNRQVKNLIKESQDWNQETRVTVYVFGEHVRCVAYDIDVLRLPSIDGLYHDGGMTALVDATYQSQVELAETAQRYGDHAFLTFVLTDGGENASKKFSAASLRTLLTGQGANWTVACLVPDILCKRQALACGFPEGNVMIWNVGADGLDEASDEIITATKTFYAGRATGTRGSTTLFVAPPTKAAVAATGMKPLDPSEFFLIPVANDGTMTVVRSGKKTKKNPDGIACLIISDFVRATGRPYELGKAHYELTKSERLGPTKGLAVVDTETHEVFTGPEARTLLGLPNVECRIRPLPKDRVTGKPKYKIYVCSESVNRHLVIGTTLLLLK